MLKPVDRTRPIGAPTEGQVQPLIEGPSPVWDVLWEARLLLDPERHHRTVLLVTDGKASGNTHGFDDTLHALALGGVTVSVVGEAVEATLSQVAGQLPAKTEWPIEQILGRLVTDSPAGHPKPPGVRAGASPTVVFHTATMNCGQAQIFPNASTLSTLSSR